MVGMIEDILPAILGDGCVGEIGLALGVGETKTAASASGHATESDYSRQDQTHDAQDDGFATEDGQSLECQRQDH